jgi:trehalose-6-phosphate synthase
VQCSNLVMNSPTPSNMASTPAALDSKGAFSPSTSEKDADFDGHLSSGNVGQRFFADGSSESVSFEPDCQISSDVGSNSIGAVEDRGLRRLWIGCPGRVSTETWSPNTKNAVVKSLWEGGRCCVPVFLTDEEMDGHYNQFCKQILWKPFHYQFPSHPKGQAYEELAWRHYVAVNRKVSF